MNDNLVSARSDIIFMLTTWAALVVEERPVSVTPKRNAAVLARFLRTHLGWLAAHPAAGDAAGEFRALVIETEGIIHPGPATRLELGRCARRNCRRNVRLREHVDRSRPPQVSCDAGHVLPPHEWLRVGAAGDGEGAG
ncbi:hypothetical protein [Amycolatopsis nigrescens]|uniref:hypothetical protein n=1 Tax=Amycolatopsis nigrescens TaxID=381445 RepID=UPI0003754CE8|nr:hypothetical protein [Amycolatopsis nigrescens]